MKPLRDHVDLCDYCDCPVGRHLTSCSHCGRPARFPNVLTANLDKHNITITGRIPYGYRASWKNRGMLAVAKSWNSFTPETNKADFQSILMSVADDGSGYDQFIEVHIFGSISVCTMQKVVMNGQRTIYRQLIQEGLKEKLDMYDVEIEVSK